MLILDRYPCWQSNTTCRCTARRHRRLYKARSEVAAGEAAANRALELVTSDDLRDFEKYRHIGVTQLYDVEERLLFPRIADRARIIHPVMRHRRRTDAAAGRNR
jgi:hypothetical protein